MPFACDTGYYFFDCGDNYQGCCSVNNTCSQQNGCPDSAECNEEEGETSCGFLCCPDDAQCAFPGYACEGYINGATATVFPSPSSSTSTITSTRTLSSTIIETETSTTSKTSVSTSDSKTDISTDGAAFTVTSSTPFSAQSSLATKATSLLTSATASSSGNATLDTPSSSATSSSSKSHGAAIGGSIGAVVGFVLALCLIGWLLVWRRRKVNGGERRFEGSDERRMQGTTDNRGGGTLDTENGTNEKTAKSTRPSIITILSRNCRRRAKHSKLGPSSVYTELEVPNGNVSNPELPSDPPAEHIAELPAEGERPAVHGPGRASESIVSDINSNTGTVEPAGDSPISPMSPMSPNLDVIGDRRGRSLSRDGHVLSFMNYNDKMPSPVR